jgi:hypothetical protein
MTAQEKADKACRILELIDINVRHALKIQAYFSRSAYHNDVGKYFDQSKAAPGYNQVVDSLYFELILTIVRAYDDLNEDKHSENTASLPELMKLLSQSAVIAELQTRSERRKAPSGTLEKDLLTSDREFLDKLRANAKHSAQSEISEIASLIKEFEQLKGNHHLGRLRSIRNELLAHTAIERNRNNAARYGDAEELLEKTARFVSKLNSAIINLHWNYQSHINTWQEHAEFFWQRVLGKENADSEK